MKKSAFLLVVVLLFVFVSVVACQSPSSHVDDNGASGTGYGSISDPTPVAPPVTDAETGMPIDKEPNGPFVLDDDAGCNPEDAPTANMEPNDDPGPGNGWGDNYKDDDHEKYKDYKEKLS